MQVAVGKEGGEDGEVREREKRGGGSIREKVGKIEKRGRVKEERGKTRQEIKR